MRHYSLSTALSVLAMLILVFPASAQSLDGLPVKDMEFEGAVSVTQAWLLGIVQTTVGDPFNSAMADDDADRLLKTGKFIAVDMQADSYEDGVRVRFILSERAVINQILFLGNTEFSSSDLMKEISARVGDPIDSFTVAEGRDSLIETYRNKGYSEVDVAYDVELLKTDGVLEYRIEEGPRSRIRDIRFEGNDSIDEIELANEIQTQKRFWPFVEGYLDPDKVESDAATLQNYYRDEGYLDARVTWRVERSMDGTRLEVIFTVVEGVRYFIENIRFEGNTVFNDDELYELLPMQIDNPMLRVNVDRSLKRLKEHYGEIGYIYSQITADRAFSEEPGYVELTFNIDEGEQIRVGRIVIRGNQNTQDKVVRRELDLFPEELYNSNEAGAAEKRIRSTQLFERAMITPVGTQEGYRDVVVNVQEMQKAGDFIFGVGVSSDSGLLGSIMLDVKNFDLFDWPRTFKEFIKMKSFRGAGQRLKIEAQPGTDLQRFRIDFTEPYLMDKPIRFGVGAYYFERGRDSYDERRVGGHVSLGRRLTFIPIMKEWYGEIALRGETVKISDLELFSPRDVRDVRGHNLMTSVKLSLVRDRTDSRFLPTRGDRLSLSYEQFGIFSGDHFFGKFSAQYVWHKTMYTDVQERKSVLTLWAKGGGMFGESPVFERYYAGGIGSMRGFEFRGVSPRQGLKDYRVGGDFMVTTGAEYSFPMYADIIRGVFFTDMGTVEEDFEITDWRASVGFGIRLMVEFLGPVPIEFDFAVPVLKGEHDDTQEFSFFIGTVF